MIKYETGGYGKKLIERVEVERETNSSVWINGSRSAKESGYKSYFDSWDDAKDHLLKRAYLKHEQQQMRFQLAAKELKLVKRLTKI